MPTIDLTDDELAAVTAAIKRHRGGQVPSRPAPRPPLRAAPAKLDPAAADALRRPLTAKAPSPRPTGAACDVNRRALAPGGRVRQQRDRHGREGAEAAYGRHRLTTPMARDVPVRPGVIRARGSGMGVFTRSS